MEWIIQVFARAAVAVAVGIIIGSERARHGRAAGMRTHILVALGAAVTAMISIYAAERLGNNGDILRLSAQVVSGVGFLGAGMIILKNNNIITGLTTAAGVWTTSVIGIAVGCGFYAGAVIVTALYMFTIILLGKLERHKPNSDVVYVEIDDMYNANAVVDRFKETPIRFTCHFLPPKSGCHGHLGLSLLIDNRRDFDVYSFLDYEHVVFVEEE